MKKSAIYIILLAAVLMAAGCAKSPIAGPNDSSARYLDAWIYLYNKANDPDLQPTGLGIYVMDEKEGDGKTVTDSGYAIIDYKVTDLEGNISSYTDSLTARQLGTYSRTSYYGPRVWLTIDETIQAGLQDAIVNMKVGGYKKVLIPSWLMTYSKYSSQEEYMKNSSDFSNAIYEFTVRDFTDSIDVWEIDSIEKYIVKEYGNLKSFSNDSTGFYYRQTIAPVSDQAFKSDTTIYINYTGKLLNGLVFDTTIERVAKDNGLYDAGKTYGPVSVKWGENYTDLTLGSGESSVITGFALTLWQMKAMESGIGIFYSPLGYSYSGSEPSIPPYAPLIFEIEIVEEPEE